ncbi:MAG TPA: hypothetical protein PLJ84_06620 [Bacteroidales bacterium]|nr:hypothetical protein [Bacteroidales bacterium]
MKKIVMLVSLVAFVMAFSVTASAQSNPGAQKATTEKVTPAKDVQAPAKSCCAKSSTTKSDCAKSCATKSDCSKTCSKPCDHAKKGGCKKEGAKPEQVPVPKSK